MRLQCSSFFLSPPLIQFCICTYVFTAAFCLQFIKEYDDDDDDDQWSTHLFQQQTGKYFFFIHYTVDDGLVRSSAARLTTSFASLYITSNYRYRLGWVRLYCAEYFMGLFRLGQLVVIFLNLQHWLLSCTVCITKSKVIWRWAASLRSKDSDPEISPSRGGARAHV